MSIFKTLNFFRFIYKERFNLGFRGIGVRRADTGAFLPGALNTTLTQFLGYDKKQEIFMFSAIHKFKQYQIKKPIKVYLDQVMLQKIADRYIANNINCHVMKAVLAEQSKSKKLQK